MLKRYKLNNAWFWFEEGTQPKGAVEEKQAAPRNKKAAPANKARKPRTKAAQ